MVFRDRDPVLLRWRWDQAGNTRRITRPIRSRDRRIPWADLKVPDCSRTHRVHKGHPRLARSLSDLDGLAACQHVATNLDGRRAADVASRYLVETILVGVASLRHVLAAWVHALDTRNNRFRGVHYLDGSRAA